MRFGKQTLQAAVMSAIAMSNVGVAQAQSPTPAPVPSYKSEKCFGVVKAGKNDCQTANASCAGTAKHDGQADAWIYLPAGSCAKIQGASLSPKKA